MWQFFEFHPLQWEELTAPLQIRGKTLQGRSLGAYVGLTLKKSLVFSVYQC